MNYYIGLDLGTSSLKGIVADAKGQIVAMSSSAYDVLYPAPGWTEQRPSDWISAFDVVMRDILKNVDVSKIKGISFGGQMHGLVVLDKDDNVIRPCILWNDGRTQAEVDYLNNVVGKSVLSAYTGNIAFAGFTAPKIMWLKRNEIESFKRIAKIMLPKDYLQYYLTGVFSTDYSDASGTLLLDVKNKCWSEDMLNIVGISRSVLPELYESYEVIGTIKAEIATRYGLPEDVKVIAGAGDNAGAGIGTGTVKDGDVNISIGTSGTVFIARDSYTVDPQNALHSFAHANGKWHLMGCILSAGSCRKWWLEEILDSDDYGLDEELIANTDSGDAIFLPYLTGERSPHNDVNAKGAFIGLTATTTRATMSRAVVEGVAFAIRDSIEIARAGGAKFSSVNLCGGGAKSPTWRQIFADVLDLPVNILTTEQGPAYGATILAMVGCGEYVNVETACNAIVTLRQTVFPSPPSVQNYNAKYATFHKLYPLLKTLY